mgnify:CR=1 FL=1
MKIGIIGAGTIVPDFLLASSYIKEIERFRLCMRDNNTLW